MKIFILGSILFSSSLVAQTLTLEDLKTKVQASKSEWTANHIGQTKLVTSTGIADNCAYKKTSLQTILKLENSKLIILSDDQFEPAASVECQTAGHLGFSEKILFFQELPSEISDLSYLDDAETQILSINQTGKIIDLSLKMSEIPFTIRYDLAQSGFQNLIHVEGEGLVTVTTPAADLDLAQVDLSDVLFCDNNDGDNSECAQGNYSDVLF